MHAKITLVPVWEQAGKSRLTSEASHDSILPDEVRDGKRIRHSCVSSDRQVGWRKGRVRSAAGELEGTRNEAMEHIWDSKGG